MQSDKSSERRIGFDVIQGQFNKVTGFARVFALILLAICFLRIWNYAISSAAGIDFYQFWVIAQASKEESVGNIYSGEARAEIGHVFYQRALAPGNSARQKGAAEIRQVLQTYSSPFLYSVFRLFSSGNYERDFLRYIFVCLACTILSILAICKAFGYPPMLSFLAAASILEWFEPLRSDIRVGNVNQLQLGCLAIYIWLLSRTEFRSRHLFAGFVLGLAIMFKPNLVFIVATLTMAWLIKGRYRIVGKQYIGLAVAASCAVIVSLKQFGSLDIWIYWAEALKDFPINITGIGAGNFSLSLLLSKFTSLNFGLYFGILLIGIVSIILLLSLLNKKKTSDLKSSDDSESFQEESLMLGIGCLIYLLSTQLVWIHYMILSIPISLYLLRPRIFRKNRLFPEVLSYLLTATATLLIGLIPFILGISEPYWQAIIMSIGLVMLLCMGIRETMKNIGDPIQQSKGTAEY